MACSQRLELLNATLTQAVEFFIRNAPRAESAKSMDELKAEINPWPHNAMRHSFGSYFPGKTKDENLTASEMGNSPEVIIKHYRALVREADVTRYWHFAPENVQEDRPNLTTLTA